MSLRSRRAMLPRSTSASTTTRPATICNPPANLSRDVTSARRALIDFTTRRLNSSFTSVVIATRRHPLVRYQPARQHRSVDFHRRPASLRWLSPEAPPDPCGRLGRRPEQRRASLDHVKVYQVLPHRRSGPRPLAVLPCGVVAPVPAQPASVRRRL